MGADVRFIAFRDEPSLEKLLATPGLSGFRMFKHVTKKEWYLEGPSPRGDDITFYEPLDYAPSDERRKRAKEATEKFVGAFSSAGVSPHGLDEKALVAALAIHNELGVSTLLIYSNDDGVDAGFICEAGQVSYAKLPNRPKDMAVFVNGAAHVEAPNGAVLYDDEPAIDLHQFASEVANAFFDESGRWRVTSEPTEFRPSDYKLLGGRGKRSPLRFPGDDVKDRFGAILTSDANNRQKLKNSIAMIDEHVAAALEEQLINAERADRDVAERNVAACLFQASNFHRTQVPAAFLKTINAYLSEVLYYQRLLRPKPDFRHNIDFPRWARKLRHDWRALKLWLMFASIWT